MAVILVLAMLMLAISGQASCKWCVCKEMGDKELQKTLDYACGAGADCVPIHEKGLCFLPNTVRAHCSYAVNSFFQRKSQAPGSCDFSGTATISTSDPSSGACNYPATLSAAGSNTTTTATTPKTTTPYTATPSNGVLGGIGTGTGPSGAGINTDISDGGFGIHGTAMSSFMNALLVSSLMLLWG